MNPSPCETLAHSLGELFEWVYQVYVLSTGSRAAAHNVAEHVLASWYDLNHLQVGPERLHFVSLFDDTMDVWSTEDFNLLKDLSIVARWSQPDEFIQTLAL